MSATTIEMHAGRLNRQGFTNVTVRLGGEVVHNDDLMLAKGYGRTGFARDVARHCPGVPFSEIETHLLNLASNSPEAAAGGKASARELEWPPLGLGLGFAQGLGELSAVEPFPLDVLPAPMARLAAEIGRNTGCDPGLPATAMLAIAGGLIGRSAALRIDPDGDAVASATIYAAGIAEPEQGRTNPLSYAAAPIRGIEHEMGEILRHQEMQYADKRRAYDTRAKEKMPVIRTQAAPVPPETPPADPPPPPVPCHAVFENPTMDSVLRTLLVPVNQRGVTILGDDLGTVLGGAITLQGGKKADRQTLRRIWAGESVALGRGRDAYDEPIRVRNPALAIAGTIPPENLPVIAGRRGDARFLDCWLLYYPDRVPRPRSLERVAVCAEARGAWAKIAQRLWDRPMLEADGVPRSQVLVFDGPGKAAFEAGLDRHLDEIESEEVGPALEGAWSSLEVYAGRLALTLALLHYAVDPSVDPFEVPKVTAAMAEGAWRLVTCFKSHARRVRNCPAGGQAQGMPEGARLALNWIRNHPEAERVSLRDLTQCYPAGRGYAPAVLAAGVEWLVRQAALGIDRAKASLREAGKVGRPAGPVWAISPELRAYQQQAGRGWSLEGGACDQHAAGGGWTAKGGGVDQQIPTESSGADGSEVDPKRERGATLKGVQAPSDQHVEEGQPNQQIPTESAGRVEGGAWVVEREGRQGAGAGANWPLSRDAGMEAAQQIQQNPTESSGPVERGAWKSEGGRGRGRSPWSVGRGRRSEGRRSEVGGSLSFAR